MKTMVVILAAVLAGCVSAMDRAGTLTERFAADQTASYKDGFREGCNTTMVEQCMHTTGQPSRDEARMRADQEYSIGWNDGARKCNFCGTSFMVVPSR